MKKIRAYCSFGYAGATYEEEFEIEDNVSGAEIDNTVYDWAQQFVKACWEEIGEESEEE